MARTSRAAASRRSSTCPITSCLPPVDDRDTPTGEKSEPWTNVPLFMASPPKFLVIDDNPDSRFLLVKTLLRKFAGAVMLECQNSEAALEMAKASDLSAIICHRTAET